MQIIISGFKRLCAYYFRTLIANRPAINLRSRILLVGTEGAEIKKRSTIEAFSKQRIVARRFTLG